MSPSRASSHLRGGSPPAPSSPTRRSGVVPAVLVAALVSVLPIAACGGELGRSDAGRRTDTGPSSSAHVTAAWRVRCDGLGDCTGNPVRMLDVDNGEGGALVECRAPLSGTERTLSVRFEQPTEFGISIEGIVTSATGGRVGGDFCSVDVLETAEMISLRGPCGANPPSLDTPCQVQRVTIDEATRDVSLELRCEHMGTVDGTGVEREVTDPDTAAGFVEIALSRCQL